MNLNKKVQLQTGNNVIALTQEDITVSGVLFYQVVNPETTWSGTMVKL